MAMLDPAFEVYHITASATAMIKRSLLSWTLFLGVSLLVPMSGYAQVTASDYFPLRDGMYWSYAGRSVDRYRNRIDDYRVSYVVTSAESPVSAGGKTMIFRNGFTAYFGASAIESVLYSAYASTPDGIVFAPVEMPPSNCTTTTSTSIDGLPATIVLPATVSPGFSVSHTTSCPTLVTDATRRVDVKVTVVGIVPISLPVGTIDALQIVHDMVTTNFSGEFSSVVQRQHSVIWLGRGIGEVKRYVELDGGDRADAFSTREWELVATNAVASMDNAQKDDGDNCCSVGDPINYSSGNLFQSEDDIPGSPDGSLVFQRFYNSRYSTPTDLGGNWRHTYSAFLQLITTSSGRSAIVFRPNGKVHTFNQTGSGWVADADVTDRLSVMLDSSGTMIGAVYLTGDSETETYDSVGRLTSIHDRNGGVRKIAYRSSTTPQIAAVTDAYGRALTFSYDAAGRIVVVTDPQGSKTSFDYDDAGRLASVTHPDLSRRTYGYDEASSMAGTSIPHALTSIHDESGRQYAAWQYDSAGWAVSSSNGDGLEKVTVTYGADGARTLVDALGTTRSVSVTKILGVSKTTALSSACAGCSDGGAATKAYDAQGNVVQRIDFNGNITSYQYGAARNLVVQRIEAVGKPESRATSYRWHDYWRLPVRIAVPKKIIDYVYNGDGGVYCAPTDATLPSAAGGSQPVPVLCKMTEQATTDANGLAGFSAEPIGSPRVWHYAYDRHGNALRVDGPRIDVADISTYEYWPDNALCPGAGEEFGMDKGCRGRLRRVTNAIGHVTEYLKYDGHGQILHRRAPNGLESFYRYDLRQRLVERTETGLTTRYRYDRRGLLSQVTLPDASAFNFEFDAAHRLTGISDSLGNSVRYVLDAASNRVREEFYDPQGQLRKTLARAFDAMGRLQTLEGVASE